MSSSLERSTELTFAMPPEQKAGFHASHPTARGIPGGMITPLPRLLFKPFVLFVATLMTGATLTACSSPSLVKRQAPKEADFWIRNVALIDVVQGQKIEAQDVRLQGGRIAAIEVAGTAPKDAAGIDGTGATLIPGLVDAHIHLGNSADAEASLPNPELNLQRLLYCGVTTVFETGGMAESSLERRDDVEQGRLLGPRIFAVGPIFTAHEGHPLPMLKLALPSWIAWYFASRMTREVGTVEEANASVDALVPLRPDFLKIALDQIPEGIPELKPSVARAIVARGKTHQLRTVAHVGRTKNAVDAAEAGVAAWVHGVYKERIPDDQITKLASYGIPMAPTLVVFDAYATVGRAPRVSTALEREIVPAPELAAHNTSDDAEELDPKVRRYLEALAKNRQVGADNVRRLYQAGVVIMAGSDAQRGVYHGPGLHQELALLAAAGLSPIDVLRAATYRPAQFLTGKDDPDFGVIAVGKIADLVLLNGDPLQEVTAISKIRAVIQGGALIERHPL